MKMIFREVLIEQEGTRFADGKVLLCAEMKLS